jgi:hypothetical protein
MFKISSIILFTVFVCSVSVSVHLPDDHFLPGWKCDGNHLTFHENDLYGYINGGAELFLEFGFEKLTVQNYINKDKEITIELYHMSDAKAALGIYLMKKGVETAHKAVKARNSTNKYQCIAVKGDYYIQINNFSGKEELIPVLEKMANFILDQIKDLPLTIFDILPDSARVRGSERIIRGPYALQPIYTFGEGDILSLKRSKNAVYADYLNKDSTTYSQMMILYQDDATSRDAFFYLKNNLDPYLTTEKETESEFLFKDYNKKYSRVRQHGRFIKIVFNMEDELADE